MCNHTRWVPTVIDSAGCSDFVPCRCTILDRVIRTIGVEKVEDFLNVSRDGGTWSETSASMRKKDMLIVIRQEFNSLLGK